MSRGYSKNAYENTYLYPCPKCPSMHYPDPESQDINSWKLDEEGIKEFAFLCAWRRKGLCHGQSKSIRGFEPWKEIGCHEFPCECGK